jgi:hypothetical protein
MSGFFWNTITTDMRLILGGFSQSAIGSHFYLAGGTALALQIGHRHSVDLDFFSPDEDIPTVRPVLEAALAPFQPRLTDSAWGNLVFLAKDVRVGFYGYGHPLVTALIETGEMRLASIEDIGLMKLDALLSRAARKDFYDLYFICRRIPLRQLLDLAPQKYPFVRDFETQVIKRLAYFERAEHDPDLPLLQPVAWQTIKDDFTGLAGEIGRSWLRG